jgi:hypothetical protein
MSDPETAALLRSVFDELCADDANFATSSEIDIVSRLLEAMKHGRSSIDDLKAARSKASRETPTMWR